MRQLEDVDEVRRRAHVVRGRGAEAELEQVDGHVDEQKHSGDRQVELAGADASPES